MTIPLTLTTLALLIALREVPPKNLEQIAQIAAERIDRFIETNGVE